MRVERRDQTVGRGCDAPRARARSGSAARRGRLRVRVSGESLRRIWLSARGRRASARGTLPAPRTACSRSARACVVPLRVSATVRTRRSVGCGRRSARPCSSRRSTSQVTLDASHFHASASVRIEHGWPGWRNSRAFIAPGLSSWAAAISMTCCLRDEEQVGHPAPGVVGEVAGKVPARVRARLPQPTIRRSRVNPSRTSMIEVIDT